MFKDDFDDSVQLSEYIDIFYKRKRLIFSLFLAVLSVTLFVTFCTIPIYQSTATMIIDKEQSSSPLTGQRTVYENSRSQELSFNTHFKLILSKAVIQRVIKALDLDDGKGGSSSKDLEISSLKRRLKEYKQNAKSLLGLKDKRLLTLREEYNDLLKTVREKVVIEEVEGTRLLKISVKDTDPEQAALIANILAKQYIEFNLSNRMDSSKDTLKWMNAELYNLKKQLEDSEKEFFLFREKTKVFSLTGKQKIVDQQLSESNNSYLAARNNRLDLDTRIDAIEKSVKKFKDLTSVRSLINNNAIEDVYRKVKNLEIEYASLSKIFKSKHPNIIKIKGELEKNTARLDDELKKELASLKSKRDVLRSRELVLKDTIKEFEQDALNTSKSELEYSILQRNVNTGKQLYDTLLAKVKESDLLQTSETSNIRLVEKAITPVTPISPNKKKNILMGIIMGLACGVIAALVLEYMDQTIRTEEDILKYLEIPVLSVIPIADENIAEQSKS